MNEIIYPNLFCFIYDMKEGLGLNSEQIAKNKENFALKLQENISLLEKDTGFEAEYYEILETKIKNFTDSESLYSGYYYPVRLNDTYGLLVACSPSEENQTYIVSEIITDLKNQLDKRLKNSQGVIQKGTLGITWMILGHVPKNSYHRILEIAQDCYETLTRNLEDTSSKDKNKFNWENDFKGYGNFLGGMIFELGQYQNSQLNYPLMTINKKNDFSPPTLEKIQESYHIVIALYPNADEAKKASKLNFSWLRLFCYRHKILFAYSQSRYLKQKLKREYEEIKILINLFEGEKYPNHTLRKLKKSLFQAQNTLSHYSIDLNYMADQIRMIEVNLINYQRRVNEIKEIARQEHKSLLKSRYINNIISKKVRLNNNNLTFIYDSIINLIMPINFNFLDNFTKEIKEKYMLQIEKDYESLSPGLILLEDLINAICGITDLEQAQRDRIFQAAVGIVGIGLAIGTSLASISSNLPSENIITLTLLKLGVPKLWLSATISIVISFGSSILSIVIIFILWIIFRFFYYAITVALKFLRKKY